MRAILRAPCTDGQLRPGEDLVLWFEAGERFELPDLTLSEATEDELDDERASTEEVSSGSLLRLLPKARAAAGAAQVPDPPTQPEDLADEPSTGLFEPLAWDEADPYDGAEPPSAPPRPVRPTAEVGPHLSVVQSADDTLLEEDEPAVRAAPHAPEPRPGPWAEVLLPQPRPQAVLPYGFDPDEERTRIVLDPVRRRGWSWWACAAVDATAWAVGFGATFAVGATTSTFAAVVLTLSA